MLTTQTETTETTGRTIYDFLFTLLSRGWIYLLFGVVAFILIYLISHPDVAKQWNMFFTEQKAKIQPKKRKRSFEKRLNLTFDKTKSDFKKCYPALEERFLKYDLKVEWVNEDVSDMQPILEKKQAIIFINDYKDEAKETIMVLHNYVKSAFISETKYYMTDMLSKATDIVVTKAFVKNSPPYILDRFARDFLPKSFNRSPAIWNAYDQLRRMDDHGLFFAIFLNELDKFSCSIYPNEPCKKIESIFQNFVAFVHNLSNRSKTNITPTVFEQNGIKIRVIFAMPKNHPDITIQLEKIRLDLDKKRIDTFYVLASGSKTPYAEKIAQKAYEDNYPQLDAPRPVEYIRRGHYNTKAICYELNVIK